MNPNETLLAEHIHPAYETEKFIPPELSERLRELQLAFSHLHNLIGATIPACRHTSLALTKLEEAFMWVFKAY